MSGDGLEHEMRAEAEHNRATKQQVLEDLRELDSALQRAIRRANTLPDDPRPGPAEPARPSARRHWPWSR